MFPDDPRTLLGDNDAIVAPMDRNRFVVVGATHLDAIYRVPIEPRLGITVNATEAVTMPGGKGLNQAVAAAVYQDIDIAFITAMASDGQGKAIRSYLEAPEDLAEQPLPRSTITVLGPRITTTTTVTILVAGKHHGMLAPPVRDRQERLLPEHFEDPAVVKVLAQAHVVLVTLDFPDVLAKVVGLTTTRDGVPIPAKERPLLVLNPAPAPRAGTVKSSDIREFDWIVPNVAEARALLGLASPSRGDARRDYDADLGQAGALAGELRRTFGVSACVTASAQGCAWVAKDSPPQGETSKPPHVMEQPAVGTVPADVTGASDAFCATLAYHLVKSRAVSGPERVRVYQTAIRHASAAGSLAVETLGSSRAMPTPDAIQRLLRQADATTD